MLQQERADDYVLATGETHSVREFVEHAAKIAGYKLAWQGEGVNEEGVDRNSGKVIIKISPEFYRPAEVDLLLGSAEKARKILEWNPQISFKSLVQMMVEADLKRYNKNKTEVLDVLT